MNADGAAAVLDDLIDKQARHGNMVIELPPIAALQLAGIVLVALKHPNLPPSHQTIGSVIVAMIRGYFEDCPAVVAMLDSDYAADAGDPENRIQTRH